MWRSTSSTKWKYLSKVNYTFLVYLTECTALTFYHVGLFVHRLHHHHVSGLVDPADRRPQLHLVAQLFGHELADLAGAARKLSLLRRWNEESRSQSLRRPKPQTAGAARLESQLLL